MRKFFAIFLVLSLVLSIGVSNAVFAAPSSSVIITTATGYTSADDVQYQTHTQSGKTVVANWGARGEVSTFLTRYATEYYRGEYIWDVMSGLSGGTGANNAPSSALYGKLQSLMSSTHTFYTYYDDSKNVRDFYCYTDCVNSDISQVSIIYRGDMVTSTWNKGEIWNQEHIWPKSKLSTSKQIGDIMLLRPSNPSENSTRGNDAYGESGGYYNPGKSVQGDCARMVLYMYVRWGVTGTMWGKSGVIESLDILLQWMAEDPVDTWEMGRNDAVQSITGVRNVFVDYPEYAWLLFGEEVPEDMVTPSGKAATMTPPPVETTTPPTTQATEPPIPPTQPPVTTPPETTPPTTQPPTEVTTPPATQVTEPSTSVTTPSTQSTEPSSTPPTEPSADNGGNASGSVWIWIVIAVVLFGGVIAVFVIYKKKHPPISK